jgi:hypothetical protein
MIPMKIIFTSLLNSITSSRIFMNLKLIDVWLLSPLEIACPKAVGRAGAGVIFNGLDKGFKKSRMVDVELSALLHMIKDGEKEEGGCCGE